MSWFKIDDGFHCHPKVLEAGNEAVGLYARCGSWVSQQLTNGFVPTSIALLYGGRELAAALVEAKMWIPVDGGWLMHDYLVYNPSKDQVRADRAAAADRQKRARDRAKAAREAKEAAYARNGVSHGVTTGVTDADSHGVTEDSDPLASDDTGDGLWEDFESHGVTAPVSHADVTPAVTVPPARPHPTRSLPTEERTATASKRGTRIAEDFADHVTPDMVAWAHSKCPLLDVQDETESFVDYWIAIPGAKGLKLDWARTWKNRMRDRQQYVARLGGRTLRSVADRPVQERWQDMKYPQQPTGTDGSPVVRRAINGGGST